MKSVKSWLSWWWFRNDLRYCYCHYERVIVREKSWGISFLPRPLPTFSFDVSDAAWRLWLGWFEIRVTRPGMGDCFRGRRTT